MIVRRDRAQAIRRFLERAAWSKVPRKALGRPVRRRHPGDVRITSGRIVSGKIVVERESIPEAATVTVVTPDDSEAFELEPADVAALLEAIHEADTGQTVSARRVLSDLRTRS